MKFQLSLFYAVCAAIGVASQEQLNVDAEDRVLKGGKGGGGGGNKGGKGGGGGGNKGGKGGGGGGKGGKGGKGGSGGKKDSGGKASGGKGRAEIVEKSSKVAKSYYAKSAKSAYGTYAPTGSLAPTVLPAGKSKGKSAGVDLSWCPFGSSSKGKSNGKRRMLKGKSKGSSGGGSSSGEDLSNALGQEPGSFLLLSPADDTSLCVMATDLAPGAGLEALECTYEDSDAFKVDRYGRLHTATWSLCVTGVDGELVVGSCDTCDAVFQYDDATMMISPYGDDSVVWSLKNGKMSLMEPVVPRKGRFFFIIIQIFIFVLFTGVPPTSSPAPTASLVPL